MSLGQFKWTYYWISYEEDFSGPQETPIYRADGSVIAYARKEFVEAVSIEGTGIFLNGKMINEDGECKNSEICFFEVDIKEFPYGIGSNNNPLHPFRTVASDHSVLPFGTKLYIPALDGITMPGENGFLHDGCVTVEDTGVDGSHLDFFAQKRSYYETIDAALDEIENVTIYEDSPKCN